MSFLSKCSLCCPNSSDQRPWLGLQTQESWILGSGTRVVYSLLGAQMKRRLWGGHLPVIGDGLLVLQRKRDRWLKPGASKQLLLILPPSIPVLSSSQISGGKRITVDVLGFMNSILRTQRRKSVHSAKNVTLDSFHKSWIYCLNFNSSFPILYFTNKLKSWGFLNRLKTALIFILSTLFWFYNYPQKGWGECFVTNIT